MEPTAADALNIVALSLYVSGTALLLASLAGLPLGMLLALSEFRGRTTLITLIHAGMALPTVVVGLVCALLLWRSGPLGALEWIYTPTAMVLAQTIIVMPIMIAFTLSSIEALPGEAPLQALSLGARPRQLVWTLMREARLGLIAALMAGFGRAISEVGAVMIVGGNIQDQTRVLTTAIVLETRRGNFELALLLGGVLMALALGVSLLMSVMRLRHPGGTPR